MLCSMSLFWSKLRCHFIFCSARTMLHAGFPNFGSSPFGILCRKETSNKNILV